MKHFPAFFLIISFTSSLPAQAVQKPEWVKLFQEGRTFADAINYYFGIGSSYFTQEDADANAHLEFALNIEARVQYVISRNVEETDNALKDEYSATARVASDVVLLGVSIMGRYEDRDLKQSYALIQIQKMYMILSSPRKSVTILSAKGPRTK
jgi:hypothetical protein